VEKGRSVKSGMYLPHAEHDSKVHPEINFVFGKVLPTCIALHAEDTFHFSHSTEPKQVCLESGKWITALLRVRMVGDKVINLLVKEPLFIFPIQGIPVLVPLNVKSGMYLPHAEHDKGRSDDLKPLPCFEYFATLSGNQHHQQLLALT
jgi:hypothetical protein